MTLIRKFNFNKSPNVHGYFTFRTTDKISSVWTHLGRFKSKAYSQRIISSLITSNKKLIPLKSEQLAYTIRQSEQYFKSAKEADFSIKPLLIYYGMVGLAKSLIISGDNEYLLNATKLDSEAHGSHGLSWKARPNEKQDVKARDKLWLVDEFCRVRENGLYPLFRSCYCNNPITPDTRITVKELLSFIGENWKPYHDFFKSPPNIYGINHVSNGNVEIWGDSKQIIEFNDYFYLFHRKRKNENAKNTLFRLFPELSTNYIPHGSKAYKSINDATALDSHIITSAMPTLEIYALIQPYSQFKFTDFDIYFILFFILGNLSRYRQDKWHKIIQREDKKDEFFLIENIFELIQYKFPLMILKELENKDYRFIGEVATFG